ncbi:MAG: glycoside hydrolase family 3 N-terminal domain-containing protein [Bacteroidota bacterium]
MRSSVRILLLACSIALGLLSCSSPPKAVRESPVPEEPGAGPLPEDPWAVRAPWVDSVLGELSLRDQVAQMVTVRAYGHYQSLDADGYARLARLVADAGVGGVTFFQGDVYGQALLVNRLQEMARLPLLVSADYERGAAMRLRRATLFPDAMALGAGGDPDLVRRVGCATAEEARAVGVHLVFAPVADVNNNPRNPVINTRSFGEDPAAVSRMVRAFLRGLHEGGAVATVKHFPGHGDTEVDSHLQLPLLAADRSRLDSVELVPFREAVRAGAQAVMIAHMEVPALDARPGIPASLSAPAVTGLLRGEMGFRGLVITDAMDMRGLSGGFTPAESAVRAVLAGADMLLLPADAGAAITAVMAAVQRGEIPASRISESAGRILTLKHGLRLHENRRVDVEAIPRRVAVRLHRVLAGEAARAGLTLLRNDGGLLPLGRTGGTRILPILISDTDDYRTDVHRASSPWPAESAGAYFLQQFRRRHPAGESVRVYPSCGPCAQAECERAAARADVILVSVFARARSSSGSLGIPDTLRGLVRFLQQLGKPLIAVAFGSPYVLESFPRAAALLCAYGDGEDAAEAVAEALFGETDVRGCLPVSIPGLAAAGEGLTLARTTPWREDPAAAGFDPRRLARVDSLLSAAIRDSAFPGAQVLVIRDGIAAYDRAFGACTYAPGAPAIDRSTIFDLASLTKVVATTAAVMLLTERGVLGLDSSVGAYLPSFAQLPKSALTIRHLLTHRGGFPPFLRLWRTCRTPAEAWDSILAAPLVAVPGDSTLYSDIGMILLGKVVERAAGVPLDEFVRREFYGPLGMARTMFRPSPAEAGRAAPTEADSAAGRVTPRGTVHDENAAFLGGVAGHAGLFSNAGDLGVFMCMLMNGGAYGGRRYLQDSTVARFIRRQDPQSSRALGWDTRSEGPSPAGRLFSPASFGHTGFTGTSLWADPGRRLCVVFLTNRVFPTRANGRIFAVRPLLHDLVIEALAGDPPPGAARE